MKTPQPPETHVCRECGQAMAWIWSQGTWDDGCWLVVCRNVSTEPGRHEDSCPMAGEPFYPEAYTAERFARRRAVRVIYRARTGIIYRNPEATVDQWIAEAVDRGILPADWATRYAKEVPA